MKKLFWIIIFLSIIKLLPATYYINNDSGIDDNDGSSDFPWKTISNGIALCDSGDVLDLTGTFLLNQDSGVTSNGLEVIKDLTLQGHGANVTFIKAAANPNTAASRVLYIGKNNVEIRNISIENGVSVNGGGIYYLGNIILDNVNISNNHATNGGGIYTYHGGLITMKNSTIHHNIATNAGGGLYLVWGACSGIFENSTISSNVSSNYGGGICYGSEEDLSILFINSCTFANNRGSTGSCFYSAGRHWIAGHAEWYAYAFYDIKNSIFFGESNICKFMEYSGVVNRSYTICSDSSMVCYPNLYGNMDSTNPLLDDLKYNDSPTMTNALLPGSPAIDVLSGPSYNEAPILDQRGKAIVGEYKDIGSFEYGYTNRIVDNDPIILDFILNQNYPNPFNPTTIISYNLSKKARVELNVYNLNGQLVQSLVNGKQDKGIHQTEFKGAYLTTGIYVYSLKIDGKTVQSRKMMLLK